MRRTCLIVALALASCTRTVTRETHTSKHAVRSTPAASAGPQARYKTLHVEGRQVLDTCGQPWQARGVEQLAGTEFSPDKTWYGLASELIQTGSNAVRLLPRIKEMSAKDLDEMLTLFMANRVVVYISPGERAWFARADIQPVLKRHEKGLILDAFQEPDYRDVPRWIREAKESVQQLRAMGYVCPLTVLADNYGRNLTALLEHGQEIADSDPLHNLILGWQAYWGKSQVYQKEHKMSLAQAVARGAQLGFPLQLGIDLYADPKDEMDYAEVMELAHKAGMGWLWWDFWNQWDGMGNNASIDGTAERLTAAGTIAIRTHPYSIMRTSQKACFL